MWLRGFWVATTFSGLACRKPWLSRLLSSLIPGKMKPEELDGTLVGWNQNRVSHHFAARSLQGEENTTNQHTLTPPWAAAIRSRMHLSKAQFPFRHGSLDELP